jgi:hypothetical protein
MAGSGKTGDWKKLERMLSEAGNKLKREIKAATDKSGRLIEAAIVGRLEQQKVGPPLSPRYLAAKVRAGYSEKILIRTATLMQNIRYQPRSWDEGYVGILRNVKSSKGQDLVNIAAVHEFGAPGRGIPARPYIGPGGKESADQVVRNYEEAVERVFRR